MSWHSKSRHNMKRNVRADSPFGKLCAKLLGQRIPFDAGESFRARTQNRECAVGLRFHVRRYECPVKIHA